MSKLRRAICGDNNGNLDDLKHMTGEEKSMVNLSPYLNLTNSTGAEGLGKG